MKARFVKERHPVRFQFQTGSIKRIASELELIEDLKRFNSKLVRLKANPPREYAIRDYVFQFQTGSIKREL